MDRATASPGLVLPRVMSHASVTLEITLSYLTEVFAFAALVFSGPLSAELPRGVGLFLMGLCVGSVALPLLTRYRGLIAAPRSPQVAILAGMAASVAHVLPAESGAMVATNIVVAILVATAIVGAVMYAAGRSGISGLVRFIPYPVVAGFFFGLGLLVVIGSFKVALEPVGYAMPADRPTAIAMVCQAGAAAAFALLLLILRGRVRRWLLMPLALLGGIIVLNGAALALGFRPSQFSIGHAIGTLTSNVSFLPVITPSELRDVNLRALLTSLPSTGVLALLSIITLLMEVSGLELLINKELDPSAFLRGAGLVNMISAPLGAPLSGPVAMDSAHLIGTAPRGWTGVPLHGLLPVALLLFWPSILFMVPAAVVGGVLLVSGFDQCVEWFWRGRRELPKEDLAITAVIALCVGFYGILPGVALGVALAAALFVYRYSRLRFIRARLPGSDFTGNVDRDAAEQEFLAKRVDEIQILQLQGFLFFGTAYHLIDEVKKLLAAGNAHPLRFIILDFRRVDALDVSALRSLARLMQMCEQSGIELLAASCARPIAKSLALLAVPGRGKARKSPIRRMDDIEAAYNWCCDKILEGFEPPSTRQGRDAVAILSELLGDEDAARAIAGAMTTVTFQRGGQLFRTGDRGDCLYLISEGSIAIRVERPDGTSKVIRTIRCGAIFGEMAFYTGSARSASAIAVENCVLYSLDKPAHEKLGTSRPGAVAALNTAIIRMVAERLYRSNREVAALSE